MPITDTASSRGIETPRRVSLTPCFIYINGYPGVGKLTVAKELAKLVPGSKMYHNHLLIDPAAAIVDRDTPHYDEIRTSVRRHLLDIIATSPAAKDITWIFTDSRRSNDISRVGAQDYENAAAKRGVPFVSVILSCELEENLRRVGSEERRGSTTKLTDPEVLRAVWEAEEIHRFGGSRELEIDNTTMEPKQAALRILEHAKKVVEDAR